MSYDIAFKVKVEGTDTWVTVGEQTANITYNVREIICKSTGLEWKNVENNGLVKDVIPSILHGVNELLTNKKAYKPFEPSNGWGTVASTLDFFNDTLRDGDNFRREYPELVDIVTFWIV